MATPNAMPNDPRNPYEFTRSAYDELLQSMPQQRLSERSAYEEIELVEDCTLYDIYRQPRAPITDPKAVRTLPVRVLNADLTCPICLGILRKTKVVMECLHRFCGECIETSLRLTKRECPSCRIHVPSKRSLRADPNFDALIHAIYPDLDAFQQEEEALIAKINQTRHLNNALTESTKRGVQHQQDTRRNSKKRHSPEPSTSTSSVSSNASDSDSESSPSQSPVDEHMGPSWAAPSAPASTSNATAASTARTAMENARKKPRTSVENTRSTTSPPAPTTTASSIATTAPNRPLSLVSMPVSTTAAPAPTSTPAAASTSTPESTTSAPSARTPAASTTSAPAADEDEKVNIRVSLHPEDKSRIFKPALLRTSYKLKIRHLKKHLFRQLGLEMTDDMRILLSASNYELSGMKARVAGSNTATSRRDLEFDQELEDDLTLHDIYKQYGMGTHWELLLLFHFSEEIIAGVAQF